MVTFYLDAVVQLGARRIEKYTFNSRKCTLINGDRVLARSEGEISEGPEVTFGEDGNVHYLDCVDGFTDVYTCQFIKLFTLNACSLLYGICTSVRLFAFLSWLL